MTFPSTPSLLTVNPFVKQTGGSKQTKHSVNREVCVEHINKIIDSRFDPQAMTTKPDQQQDKARYSIEQRGRSERLLVAYTRY
jgi:hypothetical protein